MPQIAFLTLFLGLASGVQSVAVSVVGTVSAVEFRLDGHVVARLTAPPWRAEVDLGPGLLPHTLEARALNAENVAQAEIQQLINLPRAAAEAEIQLDPVPEPLGEPRTARILWQSLTGESPVAVTAQLDGAALLVEPNGLLKLPAADLSTPHVLSAELTFANGVSARRDTAFGGDMGSELRTEITAVVLRYEGRGRAPDLPGDALRVSGAVMAAVASETAPARVLVVRDPSALGPMLRLLGRSGVSYSGSLSLMPSVGTNGGTVSQTRLASGDTLRFLWPQASPSAGRTVPLELFQASHDFAGPDGSVAWLLTHVVDPRPRTDPPRLADAVAVAGLQALGGNGRRAVLLILGGESADPSQCDAATVAAYLRAVRVPLLVWRLERHRPGTASSAWGEGTAISSAASLSTAISNLERELSAQRLVWIDGARTPAEVELSSAARAGGWQFAGEQP